LPRAGLYTASVIEDALLVGNPTAQSGRARALIDVALARLRARGLRVTFLSTLPGGATTSAVRDALERGGYPLVVVVGGDGTFAEVARGVLAAGVEGRATDRRVGLLPAGTANDLARSFGLAPGLAALEENVDVVLAGHVTRLDAGRVRALGRDGRAREEALFFDSVGWGMHPDVLARRNADRAVVDQIPLVRELYRDQAVYAGAILNRYVASWIEPTKFDAEVRVDGRLLRFSGLTDLIVNGSPVYAGNWLLDRAALPDDGRFELVPIQGRRDWFQKAVSDLVHLPEVRDGLDALGVGATATVSGASFEVQLSRPARPELASQLDGEEWLAGDRFEVDVLPRALPLLTRAGWVPPWRP
jgi:diacylglycerol kinase family enzyme